MECSGFNKVQNQGETPSASTQLADRAWSCNNRFLGRRTRIALTTLAAAVFVSLHVARDTLYAPSNPGTSTRSSSSPEKFDWYAVCVPSPDLKQPKSNFLTLLCNTQLEPSTEITWTPCFDGHQCARLLLPLDYQAPTGGPTTAIALRMIPAPSRGTPAYRGPVLVNPGGPGGSGTDLVRRAGANISHVLGDGFDVLGFDPRGTGASTPNADCFGSAGAKAIWETQVGHQFLSLNASEEEAGGTLGLFRARLQVVGERCEARIGGEMGIARFMSTASVARDMLEITQKMGQEKLHYWGFSYGSVLGQYFAAMYPDKVARVVIDGVYDSHNYRAALWSTNLLDTDAVIDSLFTYCHAAGPLKCALYEPTPARIRERYFRVVHQVAHDPVPIPHADPPLVVTRKALLAQLFAASYKPLAAFGAVVDTIRALESSNHTALALLAPLIVDPTKCECDCDSGGASPWLVPNDAFSAIACGDGDAHAFDPDSYQKHYSALLAQSPLAGPIWAVHHLRCAEWQVRPKWRYTGPLASTSTSTSNGTAHPLLLVSPRWDPVCPLRDAGAVRERYAGAGLLVQNSHGHCSLSAPSLCTARHVRAYMVNGTLPEEGTVCEVDELPFVGSTASVKALSAEEQKLLEALRGLANEVPMFGMV